jgi:hypothetical protein
MSKISLNYSAPDPAVRIGASIGLQDASEDVATCISAITIVFIFRYYYSLRPLLIDSDVTVSTLGQKSSRVLGEK